MLRPLVLALHAVALLAVVAPWDIAFADGLSWHAPGGCPDVGALRTRIETRLDRSLDDVEVGIDVDVTRRAGRYVARLDLGAITVVADIRTLTSPRCAELADAVAVIVARVAAERFALRTSAVAFVDVAATDDPGDLASAAQIARTSLPSVPLLPRPRRWALGARVSGLSGIGVIPKVGLGGELAATVRHEDRMGELGVARWMASAAQLHDGAPAKVDVDLDVAVLRYGWRPVALPLRAWLAAEGGAMRGGDRDVPGEQFASGRWLAAGAGFSIAWQMRPWARLVGGMEVMVAIERVRFAMGEIVAYAPSPMSVRTSCGLELGWQ